ncbi:hypothetical protein NC652_011052 [Populus alba x Populus x berolinensis]|nr:hypothetical protein NC652_011052 [Populus alba x Populus x berolinensis]
MPMHLEPRQLSRPQESMIEDEEEIVRKSTMGRGKDEKMIFVGLWRIQTNPSDRASTTGYVDNRDDDSLCQCQAFSCGDLTNINYPFPSGQRPPDCGPQEFHFTCYGDKVTTLIVESLPYRVNRVNQTSQTLRLSRSDFYDDLPCTHLYSSTTFDNVTFSLGSNHETLSLFYGCKDLGHSVEEKFKFSCPMPGDSEGFFKVGDPSGLPSTGRCRTSFQVPFLRSWAQQLQAEGLSLLVKALKEGFDVRYSDPYSADCQKCSKHSGRQCGFDAKPICICNDLLCSVPGPEVSCYLILLTSPKFVPNLLFMLQLMLLALLNYAEKSSNRKPLIIGVSLASGAVLVIFVGCWIMVVKQVKKRKSALVQSEGLPTVTPTPSNDLATSTNFFRATPSLANLKSDLDKGSTYLGVRVFSYNELEEATNCFDSSKELGDGGFGTVYYGVLRDGCVVAVKRLYESNMRRAEQFMNEIEILAQLRHKNLVELYGCTSRHSRELLLVYEYMPNGTVADHLHGRQSNSGLLTWPSDVYSYGVVLIELISALEAVDITRHRHDINLSTMAVNKIQNHALNELVDPFLGFDKDFVVREMVSSVAELAFLCLQHEREMRPTMEEVLEVLRGIERENYGAGKGDVEC